MEVKEEGRQGGSQQPSPLLLYSRHTFCTVHTGGWMEKEEEEEEEEGAGERLKGLYTGRGEGMWGRGRKKKKTEI